MQRQAPNLTLLEICVSTTLSYFLDATRAAAMAEAQPWNEGLRAIASATHNNPDLAANIGGSSEADVLARWMRKYRDGYANRPSLRHSQLPGTIPDEIIDVIIGTRLVNLDAGDLEKIKFAHRLSMSAENILGSMLEEFLSRELLPHGWHCCWGDVVRSVDFVGPGGELLQVKNRSNSENSSSSRVRLGTEITKWFRVNAVTGVYKWENLNIITGSNIFSEKLFREFVVRTISENPLAIAVERANSWVNI